jgi:hypothetical protein
MKKLKFPLLGLGLLFAVSAVFAFAIPGNNTEKVNNVKKVTPSPYHYKSSSTNLVDMQNISNWEEADESCGTSGTKPCVIFYEGDLSQFNAYLQTFDDPGDITARAEEKKN